MGAIDPNLSLPADVARKLVGTPVDWIESIGGGRNSRVYRVDSNGRSFALKQYPTRGEDARDRQETERQALDLMEQRGFRSTPRVVVCDRDHNFTLLTWIDGVPVTIIDDTDIDNAADFIALTHDLCTAKNAFSHDKLGAEACLSGVEVEVQIAVRLAKLLELKSAEPQLRAFLDDAFQPTFDRCRQWAKERMRGAIDRTAILAQEKRSLVPSDFGFHNSLRRPNGSLAFVDFEYFGWDDPVKLTADFLLHPGTPITNSQRFRFRKAAERIYGGDKTFRARFKALYPMFGLRWVLILLNEFLPDRWRRRVAAGIATSWDEAKKRQLIAASKMLAYVDAASMKEYPDE